MLQEKGGELKSLDIKRFRGREREKRRLLFQGGKSCPHSWSKKRTQGLYSREGGKESAHGRRRPNHQGGGKEKVPPTPKRGLDGRLEDREGS